VLPGFEGAQGPFVVQAVGERDVNCGDSGVGNESWGVQNDTLNGENRST
jgi:hypothetical protein